MAAFASYFPHLLSSLILLAPSGLLRDKHISLQTRFLYSNGLLPECVLKFLVKRRLSAGPLVTPGKEEEEEEEEAKKDEGGGSNKKFSAEDAITEELVASQGKNGGAGDGVPVLSRNHPGVSLANAVNWQVSRHVGFVHSFMSSMRFGPILKRRQVGAWERLGGFLAVAKQQESGGGGGDGGVTLTGDKVFVVCGNNDPIIVRDELVEDASAALRGNVQFKFLDAGHEFPSTKYDEVAQFIWERALN